MDQIVARGLLVWINWRGEGWEGVVKEEVGGGGFTRRGREFDFHPSLSGLVLFRPWAIPRRVGVWPSKCFEAKTLVVEIMKMDSVRSSAATPSWFIFNRITESGYYKLAVCCGEMDDPLPHARFSASSRSVFCATGFIVCLGS